MMCNPRAKSLIAKSAVPASIKTITVHAKIITVDEAKLRRLNLKHQHKAYKASMADHSQIFDGRDLVPEYNSKIAKLDALKKFYRPVKNSEGLQAIPSIPPETTTDAPPIDAGSAMDVEKAPEDASKYSRSVTSSSSANTTSSCMSKPPSDTLSTQSKPQDPTLIRRKKSHPQHKNHEFNQKLASIMKSPRYMPSKPNMPYRPGRELRCSLQDSRQVRKQVDERLTKSMVEFRSNVEVYCYKL